jgi:hypothetical protein
MLQMTTPIKIKTQLFRRRERVFVALSSAYHAKLERFEDKFVDVLLENEKREKICSFAAKISKTRQLLPRGVSNRMYIGIPLPYRQRIHDYMFDKDSVTVTLSEI